MDTDSAEQPPNHPVATLHPRRSVARVLGFTALALVALVLLVPLIWPVPPIPDAVEPSALADPDSRFVELDGISFHYVTEGDTECAVILLHGFGASTVSWETVLPDLSARCTAIAFDRPAFGLTQRLLPGQWEGDNPYTLSAAADQTVALMDALGIEKAVLVGHSAGGAVAVVTAAEYPERVRGLVLEAPAIYADGGPHAWLRPVLTTPQARRIGPLFLRRALAGDAGIEFVRGAWADPDAITDEAIEAYRRPLQIRDWDRALWEYTIAPQTADPVRALADVRAPVLVIAGKQDTYVPFEQSVRVADELGARLVTFEDAAHIPHEEFPERFVNEIYRFLDDLAGSGEP